MLRTRTSITVGHLTLGLVALVTGCDKTSHTDETRTATASPTTVVRAGSPPRLAGPNGAATSLRPAPTEKGVKPGPHPSETRSKPQLPSECADDKDNDGDGLVDWQYDLGCYGPDDVNEGGLATRELDHGWTVFEPSKDTRIIYVSSSAGRDGNLGTSPSRPKKTLAAAVSATREGRPDWVLLARGDIWHESLPIKEGRSRNELFVVATYGDDTARPTLKTGASRGIREPRGNQYNNFAVVGVAFYGHTRDPRSPDYVDSSGDAGFSFYSKKGATGKGILLEDCHFNFYRGNVIQGPGVNQDIVLRRNIFTNNYNTKRHPQGIYSNNATILLEENVFDHNGWYKQQVGKGHDKEDGQATMLSHNAYLADQHGTVARRNIFMRPSSIGTKWTANSGPASASDIVIEDNLYIDTELAISIGGNDNVAPHRFKNIVIKDNVILDVGRSRPTNRDLGWCIKIDDWDGGEVVNNLCIHQPIAQLKNVRAIMLEGVTRDVLVANNVIHGLHSTKAMLHLAEGATKERVVFRDNLIQNGAYNAALVKVRDGVENFRFEGNRHLSGRSDGRWFEVDGEEGDIEMWNRVTGGTDRAEEVRFPDPTRSIETYQKSLHAAPTIDAFIGAAVSQSKYTWKPEYTAKVVNDWLREGFAR